MIGGLVEIAESGRHLSVHRGFLKVSEEREEIGRVPLDDITALILTGHQTTLSKNLMVELADRHAVIVTCGQNWHPVSFTLPFAQHFESAGVLHDQIDASEPLRKRLWQIIVKAKISNQRIVLERHSPGNPAIKELALLQRRVKSGDPKNMEAQAARHYWTALMGKDFRRDRRATGINAFLNYGYTVLRAATARMVCGAGLHPSLGLHHGSRINPFALIDDVMEPFRPMVDSVVRDTFFNAGELNSEGKRALAAVLQEDMVTENGASPVMSCLSRLTQSLTGSLRDKKPDLAIATIRPPGQLL
jgi:CRISPR-associated protein Cas1